MASASLPLTLGIIGGGQLARMTAIAAAPLGIRVSVLHPNDDCPAAPVSEVFVGKWTERDDLETWAKTVDVVTLEHEFVAAADLSWLTQQGHCVWPSGTTLELIQDKWRQRSHLLQAGLPVPRFRAIDSLAELRNTQREWDGPLVVKTRRLGYDGHGTAIARKPDELQSIWQMLCLDGREAANTLMVEEFIPFERELGVMVARRRNGDCACYPVTETVQENYVCARTITPAPISKELHQKAESVAIAAVQAVESVGVVGVELFLTESGDVLVNELAPRPHNSGHYTLNGCVTSQFEQHVRAVLDLPLGSTELLAPSVVMANVLGTRDSDCRGIPLAGVLQETDTYLHWYGKADNRPGRKLGHVNAIADNVEVAIERAERARQSLDV
ncbi:MAG: 5-(carboxyamino)imidazole ribonucleotide synthase [Cyanobacteria bacterium P01_E01_bin.34]